MVRGILHDVAVQHESDSRLSFGVSSAAGRAEAGRRKAQQFRSEPILRTHNYLTDTAKEGSTHGRNQYPYRAPRQDVCNDLLPLSP